MLLYLILGALLLIKNNVHCANILALMDAASRSHSFWNHVLVNGLADRGHNVTALIADLPKNPKDMKPNVRYFVMEEIYSTIEFGMGEEGGVSIDNYINVNPFVMTMGFCEYSIVNCRGSLKSKGLKQFMEQYKNEKFDLILYDYVFGPCLLGFLHIYDYPPLITVSAFPYPPLTFRFNGGHFHPSYVSYHSALLDPKNSFFDRMYNHILFLTDEMFRHFRMIPTMDKLVREIFPKDMPYLAELEKRSVISLIGSHPAISEAQPLPPNAIEIGGLNLIDTEPLPKDLEDFVNSAKKGVVLFSLGTNVKPEHFGEQKATEVLKAMSKLPEYHFLWKFDTSILKIPIPKNVMIKNFFPQRDILAHPKTKCFVTHAGGLSTQESIWFGVPMVTIPVFADQIRNSYFAVSDGYATKVNYPDITEKVFFDALKEILFNSKYSENLKLQSLRFRDRPMKPLDTAVWWIEYVLRHPNPDHLKIPIAEMSFITANSIDFILFILGIIIFLIYLEIKLIKWLCCRKKQVVKEKIN